MKTELQQIDQRDEAKSAELHQLLQAVWWTKGRTLEDTRRMLKQCDLIVAFCEPESRKLAAFSRVLTDFVYKAFIFDVIVAAPYRQSRTGRALLEAIVQHSDLQQVRHLELYCLPELVPFYEKWGFSSQSAKLALMRPTQS